MSKALTDAIYGLTDVAHAQLHELRVSNEERRRARWLDPEFAAELAAQARPLHHLPAANVWTVPALAIPFTKKVPGEFWAAVALGMAQISCPCGESPELQAGVPLPCACDRVFLFTGQSVRVAEFEHDPDYEEPDAGRVAKDRP